MGMVFGLALFWGLMPLLCLGAEKGSTKVAFSVSASNERLDAVLDKMSDASGYRISINEGWRNKVVTLMLDNVTVEEGLKTLIEVLGRPSHLLLYDEKQKKIEIVMIPGASGGSDSSVRTEAGSPRTPGQIGPSRAERVSPPARSIPRRMRQRVIPPPGGAVSAPVEVQQPEQEETPKEQPEVDTKTGEAPEEKPDSTEEVTPDSKQKGGAERKRKPADSLEDNPAS